MKSSSIPAGLALASILLTTLARGALAQPAKPAWLSDVSVGLKEGYDDNVFLSGARPPAKAYMVTAGSVAALKNHASWVTIVSPKVGVNLASALGREEVQTLSLSYAPDFVIYHGAPSESYDAHRFAAQIKAGAEPWSVAGENVFTYIDGSATGPTYPGGQYSAFGIGAPRERRAQFQDRGAISLRCDFGPFFIRPTASLLYYDLQTALVNTPGYLNFPDRYDVNGGADFGYKFGPGLAAVMGYRHGHQGQQQLSFSPYSSPSDYDRLLAGFEGKPWRWLEAKFLFGPDFRSYAPDSATHITPVNDKHPIKLYGEASLVANLSAADQVAFKYKQFQWVSSLGKVPYYDSTFELGYHRQFTAALGFDLAGKWLGGDYTSGNLAACRRNDREYCLSAALSYAVNKNMSLAFSYARDVGRNAQDGIASAQDRGFDRDLVALSATVKY